MMKYFIISFSIILSLLILSCQTPQDKLPTDEWEVVEAIYSEESNGLQIYTDDIVNLTFYDDFDQRNEMNFSIFFTITGKTVTYVTYKAGCIICFVTPDLDSVSDEGAIIDIDTERIFYIGAETPAGNIEIISKARFITPSIQIEFE